MTGQTPQASPDPPGPESGWHANNTGHKTITTTTV